MPERGVLACSKHVKVVNYIKELPMEYERNSYLTSLKQLPPGSGGQVANSTHARL